jgi:polyribonucleotide nucleotidyltransferase
VNGQREEVLPRPLFPEGFYNEINCICQVLSYDGENEPDILALVARA